MVETASPLYVVGADLALNHGALVDMDGKIVHIYQSSGGLTIPLETLYQLAREAAMSLPENSNVAIDFDITCSSWGGNPKVGTRLLLINWSFATVARELRNCSVQFVSPSAVRNCLNLSPQTSKRDVHKSIAHLLPENLRGTKFHSDIDIRGDIKDAYLLAMTYRCTRLMK